MKSEQELLEDIICGRVPRADYDESLEVTAIGFVFGVAQFFDEQKPAPMKPKERAARKQLRLNPGDEDALRALWDVYAKRERVTLHREEGVKSEILPPDRIRKPDPVNASILHRLAKIWEWRGRTAPSLTLYDGQPQDPFFAWAAGTVEQHRGALRAREKARWAYNHYKKML